ncbi:hypothetical protein [Rhizobium sp.]|jgi:hypothetical protein|uniref:hypothetical protein n=1 Tax=Rhizobium sp. TaxID=391 RepID=UPI000E807383|nr:hypothetical protein [Rhizobium sp.]
METYDFWTNLFTAYRASPDLIKVLWLLIPPGFVLALLLVLLRHHNRRKPHNSTLAFTVIRRDDGALEIYRHDGGKMDATPFLLSLSEGEGAKRLDYDGDAGWR